MSASSWDAAGRVPGSGGHRRTVRGFAVQARVVHALLLREMQTRFGRNQLGFLWLFLEPLLLASAIATIKTIAMPDHRYPGIPSFVFALVGYLPYFTFRAIIGRAPGTLRANMTLLYHSQIRLLDVVMARHLLETGAVVTIMALMAMGVAVWWDMPPSSIPMLLLAIGLLVLLANGLGLLAAAATAAWSGAQRLIQPLLYLSLPLSGALFALHSMPASVREVLLWNPQANIHEMVREAFFGHLLPSYYDIGYVAFCVAVLNLLGLAALRAVRPQLEL